MALGRKLGLRRKQLGLTLEQVSIRTQSADHRRLGISPSYISMIEHERREPTLPVLEWLSIALACEFVISAGATDLDEEVEQ